MCKRTKHLSIQDDCWIFRIEAEDFTRGGDKFRGAKFITFPGKIQNLAAKLSNRSKLNSELIQKIVCKNFGN